MYVGRSMRALMLSVVEQRAGRWGSLTAATEQVATGEEQYSADADGNLTGDQHSLIDSINNDLPSVTMSHAVLDLL